MDRVELNRRIDLLQRKLKEGKFIVAPHLADCFRESMSKVQVLDDGLVDPSTVDSRVRCLCMGIAFQNDRQEWKDAVSLKDIQNAFYQRVEYAFGQLFEMMANAKSNPYSFSDWFSSDKDRVLKCAPIVDEFLEEIVSFWENISEPTWIHLEDTFDLKAVFTGELFPDGRSNVASSTGIYFDTTVLPDPFLKISPVLQFMSVGEKCREIVRLALQVLSYKTLALADVEKPIIAILPDRHHLEEGYKNFINECAISDAIVHTKVLFGQEVNDGQELFDYYSHFSDAEQVVKKLIKPEKLVFATEWGGNLAEQMSQYLDEQGASLGINKPGQAVFMNLVSRFSQANDAFQRSLQLRGTPIIQAPTSWIWYNQMLEYNAGNSQSDSLNDLHVAHALNSTVKNEMPWMGNIPPDSLLEIRQSGALDEIRSLLKGGLNELINANPSNFYRTGDKVFGNLDAAFTDHEKKLKELSDKKWKFGGRDLSSFIVVGGITIAAALTSLPAFAALGAAAGMSGYIPTVKELKDKYKKLTAEETKIKNTGVGILLSTKK